MTATPGPGSAGKFRDHRNAIIYMLVGGFLFMGSAPLWWDWTRQHLLPVSMGGTSDVAHLSGGCPTGWQVFAQNRWTPVGTAIRKKPDIDAKKLDSVSPNIPFSVDGWVHASVAYEHNTAPFNSDVWLHMKNGSGWVSFGGVRATPTDFDPSGRSPNGGLPAPLPGDCEGKVK